MIMFTTLFKTLMFLKVSLVLYVEFTALNSSSGNVFCRYVRLIGNKKYLMMAQCVICCGQTRKVKFLTKPCKEKNTFSLFLRYFNVFIKSDPVNS